MNRLFTLVFSGFIFIGNVSAEIAGLRQIISINSDWKFIIDTTNSLFFGSDFDDSNWEIVSLPHTPKIEPLVVNKQWQGIAWYRKHIFIEKKDLGKKIFIRFEGAMQIADVWIDKKHKIMHAGGYLPFVIDISDDVKEGENIISVRLDNCDNQQVPPGKPLKLLDFNTYGGIYRNVDLILTNKLYIIDPFLSDKLAGGGVFVFTESIDSEKAEITIKTNVKNENASNKIAVVLNILLNRAGDTVVLSKSDGVLLNPGSDEEIIQKIKVPNAILWHPETPFLYTLKTLVLTDNIESDAIETHIGIRKIELKPDGFYINDSKFLIRGTNRHQEYPYIGYALSDEAQYRDAIKIKNAGFDFVRCSHYPQSEAFLNACDQLGILVMNSIPGWQFMGDSVFRKNSLNDCRNLIRRDRNHPSIIFWELSLNETQMDEAYMDKANRILDEEIPGYALSASWKDYKAYDLFIPARQHGYPPDYWNTFKIGERPLFISEYGDWEYYANNAGFNQTDYKNLKAEERTSRQFRGNGEKRLIQQALNYQESTNSNLKSKTLIGHANWLMFDYNRGYADNIEASGISDIFRIPKFSYFFFQSQRPPVALKISGVQTGPMVYIASYWQSISPTNIKVFSNCDEVALYRNGVLIEQKKADSNNISEFLDYPPYTFSIEKFQKGTLVATGYIQNKLVASDTVRTPEEPVAIELSYDLSGKEISKSGKDIVFVYAKIVDKNGTLCPLNEKLISFSMEGGGKLIGANPVKTEAGIATILLQTDPIKLSKITAKTKGFKRKILDVW